MVFSVRSFSFQATRQRLAQPQAACKGKASGMPPLQAACCYAFPPCVYLENRIHANERRITMLTTNVLYDLIARRFSEDRMQEAFLEKIEEQFDYDELAEAIFEEHESEICDIIAEMAEESLR
jgi:hypothetical protein